MAANPSEQDGIQLDSFPKDGIAAVFGASGGIGGALAELLRASGAFADVVGFSRSGNPPVDLLDEAAIEAAARAVRASPGELRLAVDATGILHEGDIKPEKSTRHIDPGNLAHVFAVNATGPALLMKHFLPLLPREGKAAFVTLSARVGSIGDNKLGGWHAYRASKAALNQLVRTAAIELARSHKHAVCVAMHPGTVDTQLTAPYSKGGLTVRPPPEAARKMLQAIDSLEPADTGKFYGCGKEEIPW